MTGWDVVGVFVGIPVLVLFLIALPIFGPVWWEALWSPRSAGPADEQGPDDAREAPGPDDGPTLTPEPPRT